MGWGEASWSGLIGLWCVSLRTMAFHFIAHPDDHAVIDWFRALPEPPEEYPKDGGVVLYFRNLGPLAKDSEAGFDVTRSPVVSLFLPQVRRRTLWTVGQVHFLAKNTARELPGFERLKRRFQRWLEQNPVVWQRTRASEEGHSYFFEAEATSFAESIFAFPSGKEALNCGRFFVSEGANEFVLDKLCKKLRLQGVDCC